MFTEPYQHQEQLFVYRQDLFRRALLAFGCALPLSAPATAEEITVFAAASLTTALAEIETAFEAVSGNGIVVSAAGSSVLARQIQQGAPADIFISASTDWMDRLEADGLVEPGTGFDLLGNRLVLVSHGKAGIAPVEIGPDLDLSALLGDGRLAMALVDSVPAGVYGKAALESLGLWEDVEERVAQADNVRAALAFVATGEAPLGIVYATDATASDKVTVIGTFPQDSHPPIVYPVDGLANRDGPGEAAFLDFLRGPEARAIFERQGFSVLVD
jgi:molybdate transport system substrate-binding protein